eukprot:101817-Amphidinium_carterae.1
MDNLHRRSVLQMLESSEVRGRGKHIRCRFVDVWKGDSVHSRMVAQEFNTRFRPDVAQCTSGVKAFRMIASYEATKQRVKDHRSYLSCGTSAWLLIMPSCHLLKRST